MRKVILVALLAAVLVTMGCLSEKQLGTAKNEQLSASENFDINGDKLDEFYFYSFAPGTVPETNSKILRYVLVNAQKTATPVKTNNLSVDKVNEIDALFEDFIKTKIQIDDTCNQKLGLNNVRCLDAKGCAKLCSENSQQCKELASNNEEVLGKYILQYVKDNTDLYSQMEYVRDNIPKLKTNSEATKNDIANRLTKITADTASINSNPLMRTELFGICDQNDFATDKLVMILQKIGKYEVEPKDYTYRVFTRVDSQSTPGKLIYTDIQLSENLPKDVPVETQIATPQQAVIAPKNGVLNIQWPLVKPYEKKSQMLSYEFTSEINPEQLIVEFEKPSITLKSIDLTIIGPTIALIGILNSLAGNYYIAIGLSFGITVIFLYVIYTILRIAYNIIRVKAAGESIYEGIKRAIGRTNVRWKTDAIFGAILFVVGVGTAFFYAAAAAQTTFDLFKTLNTLLSDVPAFISSFFTFAGVLLMFGAVDNYSRLTVLERLYGQKFKEDKDLFGARITQLKQKYEELKQLVEKLGKENFEVGNEYDVLSRISIQHIDDLAKKTDTTARRVVEENLSHVEDAIDGLLERKKTADENWSKWEETINNLVEENEEVYISNLVTIPASLRLWALNKFARGHTEKGIVVEGESIKKKRVTPEKLTKTLIDKDLLLGAIIVKDGKLVMSQMATGSGTVPGVLTVKLMGYLRSFGTKLNMHEYENMAVVGERTVVALIKYRNIESVIFVQKEKFKDAIEDWKTKMRSM